MSWLSVLPAKASIGRRAMPSSRQGFGEENGDTAAALRALRPVQQSPAADLAALPLADELPEGCVARALRSFPADAAPGPSRLRVQHLREAGPPGMAHSTVRSW